MNYRSGIKIEGLDNISLNMEEFLQETDSTGAEILEDGGELLMKEAKKRVHVHGRKHGKYPHPPGTLKNSIKVGYIKKGKRGLGIKVGIEKNQYFTQENNKFYARFVEFGTSKMIARPFMRPALHRNRRKIRNMAISKLEGELFND